jgi:imidazolonepropionase-like amidohydrolase
MKLRATAAAVLVFFCCGCAPSPESHAKAFLGALLLDGSGGPPLSNSVVVTAGGRIRGAGPQATVAVPAEADRVDGSGKVLMPALVDLSGHPESAAVVTLDEIAPEAAESALESARGAGKRVLARASTQARVRFLVEHGVSGVIGGFRDTEDLDDALVARLRDLKITVAPALLHSGAALETAKRNTLRLFRAGVPIAAASEGGDLLRELELLAEAGIPPLDVLVAGTRNGAAALAEDDRGTVAEGKRADLLVLSANPGADIRNLRQVALRLTAGEWASPR